jgi:prepilin-type N-terminal cleavage/methylation domain-containing protein
MREITRRSARGFTLIELLIVVMVIAILSAISVPGIMRYMRNYRIRAASEQVKGELQTARLRAISRNAGRGVFLAVLDDRRYQFVSVPNNAAAAQDFAVLQAADGAGVARELPLGITFDDAGGTNAAIGFTNLGSVCLGAPCATLVNLPATNYIAIAGGVATFSLQQQGTGLRRTITVTTGGRIAAPLQTGS